MLLKDEAHVLRGVPLFAGMDPTKLKLLAFASDRVRFKEGQVLFRQGDAPNGAFVILSGEVEVMSGPQGAERRIGTAGARDVVGEVAILSDQPRDTTVIARTHVEALRITKDHFHKLLACCPGTMAQIIRVLGDRMARAG
jgi:CRP-like cAMP-binding protein